VHVFDGNLVGGFSGCFLPPADPLHTSDLQIGIDDYVVGTSDGVLACDPAVCGPNGSGTCSFQILDAPIPASGIAYVNVHLDYGLKGPHVDANPCDDALTDRYDRGAPDPIFGDNALVNTPNPGDPTAGDGEGPLAIGRWSYPFSHTDDTDPLFSNAVANLNVFKRIAGAYGLAISSDSGSAVGNAPVDLVKVSTGRVVKRSATDGDGFYALAYKHTGKPTLYRVILGGDHDLAQDIELKGNGWAEVNFDVFTGTSTGEFNLDSKGKGGGKDDGGSCTPSEEPEVSCSDGVDNDCDDLVDGSDPDCEGGFCTAGQLGDTCTVASDCCSNRCKGKTGRKTCK
jgi:hypothetical protein